MGTAHTFPHKIKYNKLTHFMVHFYSCHTKNYHHVFCAAYHILHHCKAQKSNTEIPFYLCSVRSVIKSSEQKIISSSFETEYLMEKAIN